MMAIRVCIVTAILLGTAGGAEVTAPIAEADNLELTVKCEGALGDAAAGYAINEPVWLALRLRNTGAEPTSVWLNGDKYHGVSCTAAADHARIVHSVPRSVALETSFRKVTLAPQGVTQIDVLLSDFLTVDEAGALGIECAIDLKDGHGRLVRVKAAVEINFRAPLDDQGIAQLLDRFQKRFASGDQATRLRIIRSIRALGPTKEAVEFLARPAASGNEDEQLAVVAVLEAVSRSGDGKVLALLEELSKSQREAVRLCAENALQEHGKVKMEREWGKEVEDYQVSIAVNKERFSAGEPIVLQIALRNVGTSDGRITRGLPLTSYDVRVLLPNKEKAPLTLYGKRASEAGQMSGRAVVVLKPGEEVEDTLHLNRAFDMTPSGSYEITVSKTEWKRDDATKTARIESNRISVIVGASGEEKSPKSGRS